MIAALAAEKDCKVISTIDPFAPDCHREINAESIGNADVCLDFSHPSAALENMHKVIALGKAMVVGTTGWNDHLAEIRNLVAKANTGMVYGANYSIGMNIFSRICADAVKYFDRFAAYDVFGYEQHHNQKADSPSGTAIDLANLVLQNSSRKTEALFDTAKRKIESHELHFTSLRAGSIPGTHTIGFDSEADTIELTHRVRSRTSFAYGAIQAAVWISERKGCHSFSDMISEILC